MANSIITKRALATALKELMLDVPFSKITVSMICDKCGMNRKSFYYHFKDKYDLANNILDIEYLDSHNERESLFVWDRIVKACYYFYNNRFFYRRIIKMKGQNAFYDHFVRLLAPVIATDFEDLFKKPMPEFFVNFYADAVVCAFERWLTDPECLHPEQFAENLHQCLYLATEKYQQIAKK